MPDSQSSAVEGAGSATVGNTSTAIVPANGDRTEVTIVNDSDQVIYLALGEAAVLNKGIRLNALGGSYTTQVFNGAINGICASGGKVACYAEI